MPYDNPKSSNENYSKGQGTGAKPLQGDMGSEYDQASNDKMAGKCSKTFRGSFDKAMSSPKGSTG